jgi:ankyrin repeat protein
MLNSQTLSVRDKLDNTALHYAARWRLDPWIPLLVQMGAETEALNVTKETPLFAAVKQNSPSTIRILKENGAVLSSRDILGNSALHAAVRWHAPLVVEPLIDMGLDINCHALNGKTPLHDSIRLGILDIELLLIKRGADIEIRDAEGNTPLMEAVLAGNQSIMEQLVGIGADPRTRNFRGDTALHIIAAMERPDLARLLLGWGASIHAKNAWGRTPYQNALITSPGQIRTFLAGGRLNTSDDYGSTPLHIAIQERVSPSIMTAIVELGARLSSVDAEGRTPLRLALDLNQMEIAKLLADSGADVFAAARDEKTAAEIALVKGEDAVRALFSGRAMYSGDSSGNTILHYAARLGNSSMISLLLSMGAQKEVRNIAAERSAEIAFRWKHYEAAALLN